MMTTETPHATGHAVDILATAANKSTYLGAVVSAIGGLSASDIAAFGGILLAAAGFAVNTYFRWRDDHRAEIEHAARMCRVNRADDRRTGLPDTRSEPVERRSGERRREC